MKRKTAKEILAETFLEMISMNYLFKTKYIFYSLILLPIFAIPTSCNNDKSKKSSIKSEPTTFISSQNNSQKLDDITITIALSQVDKQLMKQIEEFNSSKSGYHVDVKNYYVDTETDNANGMSMADFDLIQDVVNTDKIDIVYNGSIHSSGTYEMLKNKGAFVDLYKFMGNDTEVNSSTIDEHILKLNETEGALYTFPTYYVVHTLIGEEKYVGSKENWNVDEFISHWEQMPDNSTINGSPYAENVYRAILSRNIETFLDYYNSKVNFTSPDFRRILEFCNRFPSNNNEKYATDYSAPRFVSPHELNGIMSAAIFDENYENVYHEKSKFTLVGYPSSNGCGSRCADSGMRFSICSNSSEEKRNAAWQFIRQFYTYDYQKEHAVKFLNESVGASSGFESESGFCVNKKAFEETAQDIISGKYTKNMVSDDESDKLIVPTQNDYDQLCIYLQSINKYETIADQQLRDIVDEEVMTFLAGDQDLNTTIDIIQNRATIWISEKK